MKRLLLLALLGLAACDVGDPGYVEVEGSGEFAVIGGKAVLTIIPDTVYDTTEVIVEVPIPCPECPPECPIGWTCTPPPEPDTLPVLVMGNRDMTDPQALSGTYNPGDSLYIWLDVQQSASSAIDSVIFFYNGVREQKEAAWVYALKGVNGPPLNPFKVPAVEGLIEIKAVVWPGPVEHTGVITVNPSEPPVPPDTVPVPPVDTTPEPPEPPPLPPGDSTDLALYASPWHDVYLVEGDTIMDGGYSLGVIKADSGPVVADSVWFYRDGVFHQLGNLSGGSYSATYYLNIGHVEIGWQVFGGSNAGVGSTSLVIADHWGSNLPIPDSIPLSAPANLRIKASEADTTRRLIAWDEIPEDSQCVNDFGTEVNCPNTYGDEVYYRVTEYQVWPDSILEPGRLWFDTTVAMASTQRSFPWDYPGPGEVLPDSLRFCVLAEAWDCAGCTGTGGVSCRDWSTGGGEVCSPVSEITCSDVLEVW